MPVDHEYLLTLLRKRRRQSNVQRYMLELLMSQAWRVEELSQVLDVSEQYVRKALKMIAMKYPLRRRLVEGKVYYFIKRG